jgi:hypothetical protein
MKRILSIFILVSSCSISTPKYIQGYVCNSQNKPLKGIFITDPNDKNTLAYTDREGYFKINKMIKGRYLVVSYNNKKIDSIYIVRTHPERGASYSFVEGRKDTLFIDVK